MSRSLFEFFKKLSDPKRSGGHHLYPLNEIIFLTISGVLCGAENWVNIGGFGNTQLDWLRKYLPFLQGIPSHDTLGRVFEQLDSKASINNICIGQVKTADKSNEITAIPRLLDMTCIQQCLVTIDAMGCQRKIAEQIIDGQAQYVLALKANQEELLEEVEHAFKTFDIQDIDNQLDASHGRVVSRTCELITDLRFIDESQHWKGIQSVVRLTARRTDKTHQSEDIEYRYYISSLMKAAQINDAVRHHWGIENALHWVLDVRFNEDFERKRKGNSPYNFSFMTKAVLNMIRLDKAKGSIKTKRL